MQHHQIITVLKDHELRTGLQQRLATEREQLAEFLAYLGEIDVRKLYAAWGYSSLFVFCIKELGLAENSAYRRIRTARAARTFPAIYEFIASGQTHCTAVTMIAQYLTIENADTLLSRICGQSKRAVEELIASLAPQPDVRDLVRRLPVQSSLTTRTGASCESFANTLFANVAECSAEKSHAESSSEKRPGTDCPIAIEYATIGAAPPLPSAFAPAASSNLLGDASADLPPSPEKSAITIIQKSPPMRHEHVQPLSAERIKFQFTASAAFREKFERARTLLWHRFPAGNLENIFTAALDALLAKYDPTQRGHRTIAMRSSGRHIPAQIKRHVWTRDHSQCQFHSADGTRCHEQRSLEIDHIQPFSTGGRSDDAENLRLLCRTHNQWRWEMGR